MNTKPGIPMSLSTTLTDEQKVTLQQFKVNVDDLLNPSHDDAYLFRWLKTGGFDLQKAEKMLREHFKYRRKIGLDTILTNHKIPEVVKKYVAIKHIGFDSQGHAVVMYLPGRSDIKGITNSLTLMEHIKSIFHYVEDVMQKMKEENKKTGRTASRIVCIIDCEGLKMQQFLDRRVARRNLDILNAFQANYTEMLKCVYVINVPHFFKVWLNFARSLFSANLMKKFKVYDTSGWQEELLENVDANMLPAFLGGNLTDPDGNPGCFTMFGVPEKVPLHYYLSNQPVSVTSDPDMKKIVIRERTYFNVSVQVKHENHVIVWRFKTMHHDIRFGLYYVPEGVKPMPEQSLTKLSKSFRYKVRRSSKDGHELLIHLERIECHVFPEEGEYYCEKTGTYMLHFDNTYSWMTPKELYYKAEVVPATNVLSRVV